MLEYSFTYLSCQSCTAKVHCEECQNKIAERLAELAGVRRAEVNIPLRHIAIEEDGADPDEIDGEMDAFGVFLGAP